MILSTAACILFSVYLSGAFSPSISRWKNWRNNVRIERESAGLDLFASGIETKMAIAILKSDVEAMKHLIERGVNINALNKNNDGYLQYAFDLKCSHPDYQLSLEVVGVLLDNGINLEPGSCNHESIIDCWTYCNSKDGVMMKYLLKAGAKIPDRWYLDEKKYLELYLVNGADPDRQQNNYYEIEANNGMPYNYSANTHYANTPWTIAMILAEREHWAEVDILIDFATNLSYKDSNGVSLQSILKSQLSRCINDCSPLLIALNEKLKKKMKNK